MSNCSLSRVTDPILHVLNSKRFGVYLAPFFFSALLVTSFVYPPLLVVVGAALLVRPLRFVYQSATRFEESDFQSFSPLIANRDNFLFVSAVSLFFALGVGHSVLDTTVSWSGFGSFVSLVGIVSIALLTWTGVVYEKNWYFGRWHVLERGSLVLCGALAVYSPAFVPLFLLVRHVLSTQFEFPNIGGYSGLDGAHYTMPYTMLLIIASFTFVGIFSGIQSEVVLFLLFCGYAAHYFHAGIAKLQFGPAYYIRNNNPIYFGLHAYVLPRWETTGVQGWVDSELDDHRRRNRRWDQHPLC